MNAKLKFTQEGVEKRNYGRTKTSASILPYAFHVRGYITQKVIQVLSWKDLITIKILSKKDNKISEEEN